MAHRHKLTLPLIFLTLLPSLSRAETGTLPDVQRPAIGAQRAPQLASDGSGRFYAVWSNSHVNLSFESPPDALMGARVDADGSLLDAPSHVITAANAGYNSASASVAYCGGAFVVVWTQSRYASPRNYSTVMAARIDPATGAAITAPSALFPRPADQGSPAIASRGSECLIAWPEGGSIVGTRFGASGSLDPSGLTLVATSTPSRVRLAHDGSEYMLAWRTTGSSPSLRTRAVANDGSTAASVTQTLSTTFSSTASFEIAGAAGRSLLVYSGAIGSSGAALGLRLASDGSSLDSAPLPLISAPSLGSPPALAVAATSAGAYTVLVASAPAVSGQELYAARVAADGSVVAPGMRMLPLAADDNRLGGVALARAGTTQLALFEQAPLPTDSSDINGLRLDDALAPMGAPFAVSRSAALQERPRLAAIGSVALVAWTERRWVDRGPPYSYTDDVIAARFDATGAVLDPLGIVVADGVNSDNIADVSASNSAFTVAYSEGPGGQLWLRRYNVEGRALDSARFELTAARGLSGRARLSWNGSNHLAVWSGSSAVQMLRLGNDSRPVDPTPTIATGIPRPAGSRDLVLATNGEGWLLGTRAGSTLYLLPIDSSGRPAITTARQINLSSSAVVEETIPAIISDGARGYLIAWYELTSSCTLRFARFGADGVMGATIESTTYCRHTQQARSSPAAVFDGSELRLIVRDSDVPDADGIVPTRLISRRYANDGTALSDWTSIQERPDDWYSDPALISLGSGRTLFAYRRMVNESPFGTIRVRTRVLPSPLPTPPDAGPTTDASVSDVSDVIASDVAANDVIASDASDASVSDVDTSDVAANDVSAPTDVIASDAIVPDATVSDASVLDGTVSDVASDATTADTGSEAAPINRGCGCTTHAPRSNGASLAALLALAAALGSRRARKR